MLPPALGGLRFRVPPVPGRHAPGNMLKIILPRGQGMHPSRKTAELYYFGVETVNSRKARKMLASRCGIPSKFGVGTGRLQQPPVIATRRDASPYHDGETPPLHR